MKRFIQFGYLLIAALVLIQPLSGQSPSFKTYINPVIPGDHPDATLTKVGKDFYTTGSSFNVTPVIYHSTDLVHWEAIAQPVKASWSNFGTTPGGGCWGGHVVFHHGKYWHFFSRANTMYFVTAPVPEGPWSEPVKMNNPPALPYVLGYDNSIFIDDDNKWYLVVKNGQPNNAIVELGEDGQPAGAIYNLNWLNPAPAYPYSWAEGPVIWKANGYYYYSFARDLAGGQKVMRSTVLTATQASWEMLGDFFNENDPLKPGSMWTGPNHNSPAVMLDDSTSWIIHPLYAKNEWKGQGRQGLLNQVQYSRNLKPVADYPVNKAFTAPDLPSGGIPWMVPKSDFFTGTKLHPEWSFIGFTPDNTHSLTERPGWLKLSPKSGKPNTIVKNDGEHNYSLITRVDFDAQSVNDEAGLRIIRGDETKFVKLYSSLNSSGQKIIVFSFEANKYTAINRIGHDVWLKMVRINHLVSGYYSRDGINWIQVGQSVNISVIDSYSDFTSFTGTRQGLYVQNRPAFFDLYIYRDAYSPIMASAPANQNGTIPTSANALDSIHNNDWALYAGVEFGNTGYSIIADSLHITAKSGTGGMVEIWLDSLETGTQIGTCPIEITGSDYQTFSAPVMSTTGRHDVYLKFTGSSPKSLFSITWIKFSGINAPHFMTSNTTSDSTILVIFDKKIKIQNPATGLVLKVNTEEVPVNRLHFNSNDSSSILLTLSEKLRWSDKIDLSYNSGSIVSEQGLELNYFVNQQVNNFIPDTSFHIYLMFGQSNMEGAGTIEAQDRVTNSRVWMMQDSTCPNLNRAYGQWYIAAPPLNRCWGKLGPGDSFGRIMGEQAPEYVSRIGLINVSVSGCNIYIYKKGCPNGLDQYSQGIPFNCGYTWLLDLARKAQQDGVIKGILFHQGETNNGDPNWKYTVQQIVSDLKQDLGLSDIPFLAGELLYAEYGACCSAHNPEINKLPGLIPNSHVISAKGLPGSDYAHFTSESYRTLGERYARKMLNLVYQVCDTTTIESWYRINGTSTKSNHVIIGSHVSAVLSPRPANLLGTWNWTGAVTGTSREQTISFANEGIYKATVEYTNECGAVSTMPVTITICDSTVTSPGYQVDDGPLVASDSFSVLRGSDLVLIPQSPDSTGTWSWSGSGLTGIADSKKMNTSFAGKYSVLATFTNHCGAQSRHRYKISVCDSTRIESWYQVNDGAPVKSDSIQVTQFDQVKLSPLPDLSTGTWYWSGAGTSGNSREQTISTQSAGTFTVSAVYTNVCGIESRMKVIVVVDLANSINDFPDKSVEVYPNPASGILHIRTSPSVSGRILKATVYNDLGQFMPVHKETEDRINISGLLPGLYYIRIITENGLVTRKFMKN